MFKVKLFVVLLGVLALTACSSTPTPTVVYTPAGQKYFTSTPMNYSDNVEVSIHSADEAKAVKAGYMSDDKTKEYVTQKIQEYLQQQNLVADNGVKIIMALDIDRVYSWEAFGGSSIAALKYSAKVKLEQDGNSLASFEDNGLLQDRSISGDFKTMFGMNDSSSEHGYFDAALYKYILRNLPKEYAAQ